MSKDVILTGIRANSNLHLGNYLGAILPMVELQKQYGGDYQINMFVPDLHSFTTPVNHKELYDQIIDNLKIYVAAGLDLNNPNTRIYRQSFISTHSELTVILNNFVYYGELQRMTQFKEKSDLAKDSSVTVGLFDYPVLMAADILLYGAKWVPVGEDQRQHLELARDVAARLNNKFGSELLVAPAEWSEQVKFAAREQGVRIRSLRDPSKKMSKSIDDPAGTISLLDDPQDAFKKVMSATTDSEGIIGFDIQNRPGISNLLQILALLKHQLLDDVIAEWQGKTSYGDLKKAVADEVSAFLQAFQGKLANVNESDILNRLQQDESAMSEVSNQVLFNIQKAIGLRK